MKYDYLIVGSGLYGSIFAREATNKGNKCLVIDKRGNIGGNIYTEYYGPFCSSKPELEQHHSG